MRRQVLIVSVIVIAVALFSLLVIRSEPRIVTLPDGTRVEFLGTTVGRQTFTTEKRWHKLAKRILPMRFQNWIPSTTTGILSSGTNSITVFLRVSDPTGGRVNSVPWRGYRVEDSTGFAYQRENGFSSFGRSSEIICFILRAFPRRESEFRLILLGVTNSEMVAFTVPNPIQSPFPEWKPLPLPQTQTNAAVALTLESIREGGSATYRSLSPKWNLRSLAPNWDSAKVKQYTFLDATGNEGYWLSPREPAWMVHAKVHRQASEHFSAEEKVVFTNLTLPTNGSFTSVNTVETRLGVKLNFYALANAARFYVTNGLQYGSNPFTEADGDGSWSSSGNTRIESWASSNLFTVLEATGYLEDDEIRLRLLDEQGGELSFRGREGYDGTDRGRMYKLQFPPPAGVKTVSLEVIVSRPLHFHFIVNPKDVLPPKPPSKK